MNLKICYLKIDVSCGASGNFQCISQNATPATEFAPCHSLTQPWLRFAKNELQDTSKVLRLRCKMTIIISKLLRAPGKCNASSENVAKVLRLPHKTIFDTVRHTFECHEVPCLPRETKLRDAGNLQKWPLCRTFHRHGHTALTRTVADVADGCTTSSENSKTFQNFQPDRQNPKLTL